MKQFDFLTALDNHIAFDGEETQHQVRTRAFVANEPQFFDKTHPPGHVTASAWVLNANKTAVLLTHHRKLNRWFQLGGHIEGDRSVWEAATREALEESGLVSIQLLSKAIFDIDVHTIPSKGQSPEHIHYDVRYAFIANASDPLIISAESHALRWVPLDEVATLSDEASLRRMIAKTRL